MDIKEQILVALGLDRSKKIKLAFQAKTEDGTIVVSTAEELEAGVDISVLTEDGTTIPLPAGTYKLDTGVSFRVEEEGIVAELIESETEEEETPKEEVEAAEEDEKEEEKEDDDMADVGDWEGMEKRIQNLEDAVSDLKSKIGGTDAEEEKEEEKEEELSVPGKNPRTKTTKTTETVEFSMEELKDENEKLKAELAKQPAETAINTKRSSSSRPAPTPQELRRMTKNEKYLRNLYK